MTDLRDKLTIAIPVYNDVNFLEIAIKSCLDQGATIILSDNCSTDGSEEVCRRYAAQYDFVHLYRHESNIGALSNFKFCLDQCKTPYFCWLGSHDKVTPGYSACLVNALETDPDAGLAVGTIRYIDEHETFLRKITTSEWANESRHKPPLDRMQACLSGLRRECFHFYSIFRTSVLRQAWLDDPSLGFDRVVLVRTAGLSSIIYCPEVELHAREFVYTRNTKEDRERRSKIIGHSASAPIVKDVVTRNMEMVKAVLDAVKTPQDLTQAFKIIAYINRRYQNRRFYQRIRLAFIIGLSLSVVLLIGFLLR